MSCKTLFQINCGFVALSCVFIISGCGNTSVGHQPTLPTPYTPKPPSRPSAKPSILLSTVEERNAILKLYNQCNFTGVVNRMENWPSSNSEWLTELAFQGGNHHVLINLAVYGEKKSLFSKMISLDKNRAGASGYYESAATYAWPEYKNWISCYFNKRRDLHFSKNGPQCLSGANSLQAKEYCSELATKFRGNYSGANIIIDFQR